MTFADVSLHDSAFIIIIIYQIYFMNHGITYCCYSYVSYKRFIYVIQGAVGVLEKARVLTQVPHRAHDIVILT